MCWPASSKRQEATGFWSELIWNSIIGKLIVGILQATMQVALSGVKNWVQQSLSVGNCRSHAMSYGIMSCLEPRSQSLTFHWFLRSPNGVVLMNWRVVDTPSGLRLLLDAEDRVCSCCCVYEGRRDVAAPRSDPFAFGGRLWKKLMTQGLGLSKIRSANRDCRAARPRKFDLDLCRRSTLMTVSSNLQSVQSTPSSR